MAKKKVWEKGYYPIRAIPSSRDILKSFLWSRDSKILGKSSGVINGFTLIELVIVIGLFGIFIAGAIILLDPLAQLQKANDAKRKSDLAQVTKALEQYYNDFARYPSAGGAGRIIYSGTALTWGTSSFGNYMVKLPQDPKGGRTYIYYSDATAGNQSYYLYASLERGTKDPQACSGASGACPRPSGGANPTPPTMTTACGTVCNYGISSNNVSVE